jgi:hypothetical protein
VLFRSPRARSAAPKPGSRKLAATLPAPMAGGRDLRLDFFRGLSLWFIFLDHQTSNVVAWFTVRNYGFSDAAEIFVFISGYTVAYVYGRVMRERGFVVGAARLLKRVWQLYVAFVFLLVLYLAEIAYVSSRFENPLYSEEFGVFHFLQSPDVALVQALLLRFLPANVDVLPLYIVLMLFFPPVLWLMLRRPNLTLALSVVLYATARVLDWNLALYPLDRTWFFNPFAWQLLFVIGAWCALGGAKRVQPILRSNLVVVVCAIYLVLAMCLQLSWVSPSFTAQLPNWLMILPLDKTNVSLLRLAHFLALAIIVVRHVPMDAPFLRAWWARPIILCGQHSLEVFCAGVFLSFTAYFILVEFSNRVFVQVLVSLLGITLMVVLAAAMTWYRGIERRAAPVTGSAAE